MKQIIVILAFALMLKIEGMAQVFPVDTLQYRGDKNKFINLVILGDGYTIDEQNKFLINATSLANYVFTQSPFSNYKDYFNVFAIRVVSLESGAKHPNTAPDCSTTTPQVPVSNPNTYFNTTFDYGGIHRLIVATNTFRIAGVLASSFPSYDQTFILSNTPYYGGSGGSFPTGTIHSNSGEIFTHEMGHSFANLRDEYYAGDIYSGEFANMTAETDPAQVKWKNWLGFNSVGIYQHCCGGNSALWYKPHNNCKMRALGLAFCPVCKETLIEKVHNLVNPVVSYLPVQSQVDTTAQFIGFKLDKLMKPIPNTLNIRWSINGVLLAKNVDSVMVNQNQLNAGTNSLRATVIDTTLSQRINNHSGLHVSTVNWSIQKTINGTQLFASAQKFSYAIYPNPGTKNLHIELELEKRNLVSIQILSPEGKNLGLTVTEMAESGKFEKTFEIEKLESGVYFLVITVGEQSFTERFVKE